ncbi:tetrahydromethanopterin S-methyltransferase, F subunit [Methanocaldococcus vulcanius M7]|uniref:Tetrahydromethanopterin S-methyltransferase subunit F n=1 Tax=Methanocaldococcus vulcanius (strain ATCC 700851 / DSM 12094 / M7) TaxID=579137 RepID=C9REM1_METVM|nr:tetrahydromethanopterin S-methyltransferase subunit F [Methanocaldococcus vulcanius]ACX72023.1 tetrahydromethanopterin S-methyltransferase, F subunit [Methanocaldococcus vulcanius M7]
MGVEVSNKPNISSIQSYIDDLEYKVGLITRNRGLESGVESAGTKGLIIGAVSAVVMMGIPLALYFLMK